MQLNQKEILSLFMDNEEAVEQAYILFAKLFPEYSYFWLARAQEEHRHAEMFRRLLDQLEDHTYYFDGSHFRPETIEAFGSYVRETIRRGEAGIFNIYSATDAALAIEEALLEEDVFDQFEGANAQWQQTISRMKEDCSKHRDTLKRFRDKELLNCAS
jgi:hypothetical protein